MCIPGAGIGAFDSMGAVRLLELLGIGRKVSRRMFGFRSITVQMFAND